MNKKAIFLDIDGTLFDHNTNSIPESAIFAIQSAKQNGHFIFICTGRGISEVGNDFSFLPLDGYILSCGANISIHKKNIYTASFPQDALHYCVNFMKKHHIGFTLDGYSKSFLDGEAYDMFHNFKLGQANNDSELARALLNENKMFHFSSIKSIDYYSILKISLFSKNRKVCEKLMQSLPNTITGFLNTSTSSLTHGEIMINGVTKATGIKKVLNYIRFPIEDSIAFGDSLNDIEMLKFSNIGVCMGNGDKEVKKVADFVTKSIDKNGLYYAFLKLKLL
ncbi:HAD family hydrolase [Faecalicoccus pleomorphus]|uniref:HAD family hydrolase n=1 Tax=Faecalicoccus pleomorphus TaxID=1323 RepID=UPI00195FB879|nr:HAD family hydrolase [Faecalicoccus pleomorphus]MBM6766055.1 HAD family hydrolase [Faecalicoccus pleomorphus]